MINYSQNIKSQWLRRQIESRLVGAGWGGGRERLMRNLISQKKVKKKSFWIWLCLTLQDSNPSPPPAVRMPLNQMVRNTSTLTT